MARSPTRRFLASAGLPDRDMGELPDSAKRFPDGAHYRVEIPSTEGPRAIEAVLDEAERRGVPVVRISQGSGVFMHTDEELDEMARLGASAGVEVSLFARPNAGWDPSAMARAPVGPLVAPSARGTEQLVAVLEDVRRAAAYGIRSVLIQDLGVLSMFAAMRAAGELPADMQAKVSVMLPVANPASARVIADLGASTINLPTDLTLAQIASIRAAIDVPLDIYVECPDNLGGFVRFYEIADIVRVAAPVYLKFGLRGTTDPYPAGSHLEATLIALSRERVRRARLGLDQLERSSRETGAFMSSRPGASGLAVPVAKGEAAPPYFNALSIKFVRTSSIRMTSTLAGSVPDDGPRTVTSRPAFSPSSRPTVRANATRSAGWRSSSRRPDRIRLMSRSRSSRLPSFRAPVRTISRSRRNASRS